VEIEEKRLHASMIVLEEEFDQRRLEDEHFDVEEDRLRREGAKLVHPAYQHQLKATYTDEHLTPAQKRIAERFNTGASTTVEDLTSEQPVSKVSPLWYSQEWKDEHAGMQITEVTLRDSLSGAVKSLDWIMKQAPAGTRIELVTVDRRETGEWIGMSVIVHPTGEDTANQAYDDFGNYTIGLFSKEESLEVQRYFEHLMANVVTITSSAWGMLEQPIREFIHEQVIPLEWKSYTDEQFTKLISVTHGRIPADKE